ncbi:MAG: enoyl-CoA hydratase/isomerase family protein [Actinobacteria bacterium]|nr:MAG: enoyl-CoA hydratase/isomerase family protein [Actinomycetota bacterium]
MAEEAATLRVETPESGIRVVTLNRPERLNALDTATVAAFPRVFGELAADDTCRVVVLTGAGRGFCAGLDLQGAAEVQRPHERDGDAESSPDDGPAWRMRSQETFSDLIATVRAMPQPIIAAVNGAAAGAGFAMTMASDIRLAAASARFHVAAIKLGLSGGECGMSYLLPRLVGASRAFELLLTGRPVDAAEAERIGLVSRVVPDEQLMDAALDAARMILANPPFAVAMTKRVMWNNLDAPSFEAAIELENRTQVMTGMTEDCREAMIAFAEKRPPNFTGR